MSRPEGLDEYQRLASRTAGGFADDGEALKCWALGLAGEAGEFANLIKKALYHGHDRNETFIKAAEELGDVLWYLAAAADKIGLSLSQIAEANIAKLRLRYPDGFSEERSRQRSPEVPG